MKQLITIAFSALDSRLENAEKSIDNIVMTLNKLESELKSLKREINELNIESGIKNFNDVDEVEEYKFGE